MRMPFFISIASAAAVLSAEEFHRPINRAGAEWKKAKAPAKPHKKKFRKAQRHQQRKTQMSNKTLLAELAQITDPIAALKAIDANSDFFGYDPYYGEMHEALLAMAKRVAATTSKREAVAKGVEAAKETPAGEPVALTYTNYRGETSVRRITPMGLHFGSTDWHPEPQWLVRAYDHDKQATRDFAFKDFGKPVDVAAVRKQAFSDIETKISRSFRDYGWCDDVIFAIRSLADAPTTEAGK